MKQDINASHLNSIMDFWSHLLSTPRLSNVPVISTLLKAGSRFSEELTVSDKEASR